MHTFSVWYQEMGNAWLGAHTPISAWPQAGEAGSPQSSLLEERPGVCEGCMLDSGWCSQRARLPVHLLLHLLVSCAFVPLT